MGSGRRTRDDLPLPKCQAETSQGPRTSTGAHQLATNPPSGPPIPEVGAAPAAGADGAGGSVPTLSIAVFVGIAVFVESVWQPGTAWVTFATPARWCGVGICGTEPISLVTELSESGRATLRVGFALCRGLA